MVLHQHGGGTLVSISHSIFTLCVDNLVGIGRIGCTSELRGRMVSNNIGRIVGTCKETLRHVRTLAVKNGSDIRKCIFGVIRDVSIARTMLALGLGYFSSTIETWCRGGGQ